MMTQAFQNFTFQPRDVRRSNLGTIRYFERHWFVVALILLSESDLCLFFFFLDLHPITVT